jgi:hypothetical protein
MRNALFAATLLLVVVMPTQWDIHLGGTERDVQRTVVEVQPDGTEKSVDRIDKKREGGVHLAAGDALLVVLCLAWAAATAVRFRFFEIRWPPVAAFVLFGVVLIAAVLSKHRSAGLKEAAQLGACFIGGWLVFANCLDTRPRLKAAVDLFSLVVAAIVVLALVQYRAVATRGNAFEISGSFGNRNVLGAFFAIALPFLFSLGLHERRIWQRFALIVTVGLGAMVTLSGGALLALAAGLFVVAAMRSSWAVAGVAIAVALALVVLPGFLALPKHSHVVVSSISPTVVQNYLDRPAGEPRPPVDTGGEERVLAARYKRWNAALARFRGDLFDGRLFGAGPGRYHQSLDEYYAPFEKPSGDTDDVTGFNITTGEPDSFNTGLILAVTSGPLALAALLWLGASLVGGNLRRALPARDATGRALAVGAAGAIVATAVCSVFTDVLVRGVSLPFIFVALSGILWAQLPQRPDFRPSHAAVS